MKHEEKTLPKGFRYRQGVEVLEKLKIISAFTKLALKINAKIVEFPPVAFLSNYIIGAKITGDKIYTFKDKKGKDLVLTPDSLAHTFNFYTHNANQNEGMRLAWICPTFRYWNIKNRYFFQLGLTSLNSISGDNVFELALITRTLLKLIQENINTPIRLHIINPGLVKEVLFDIFKDKTIAIDLYEQWRKADSVSKTNLLKTRLPACSEKDFILKMTSSKMTKLDSNLVNIQYKEIDNIKKFISCVNYDNNVRYLLDISNTHSSEIMTSVGFIIETNTGQKIGDGGLYDRYGNNFCNKIYTVCSVCTGLDAIFRNIHLKKEIFHKRLALVFISLPVNQEVVMYLHDLLVEKGFDVSICFESKSNKIKNFAKGCEWCCIIEKIEHGKFFGRIFKPNLDNSQQKFNAKTVVELEEMFLQ